MENKKPSSGELLVPVAQKTTPESRSAPMDDWHAPHSRRDAEASNPIEDGATWDNHNTD